ncbi:MAG: 3-phosphoserine/phosphohydroxythreonine transaminase, partial [Candidatus Methylopumilus sp.]
NLLNGKKANYIVSGYWSKRSYQDALPFGDMTIAASSEAISYTKAPDPKDWKIDSSAAYVHFCSNETIHGVEYFDMPSIKTIPVVADMSSHILSRPVDISQFGVIYAGAQKNIGPAGLTIVIVRDDLLDVASPLTPSVFNWKTQVENQSMINTPTTYSIYMAGLVFEWLIELGGLEVIEKQNIKKAELLYGYIDSTDFYYNPIDIKNRSRMNVPFRIQNEDLHASFVTGAENLGMIGLKGHRLVGGIRASIYNAMSIEGIQALVDYMKDFEKSH